MGRPDGPAALLGFIIAMASVTTFTLTLRGTPSTGQCLTPQSSMGIFH